MRKPGVGQALMSFKGIAAAVSDCLNFSNYSSKILDAF